jgi:transcriptional regulator with XRE-family HTH domain
MSFLGEYIKAIRAERGLSLQGVATRSGLSKAYIWELERGRPRALNPTIGALVRIAAALRCVEPEELAKLAIADAPPVVIGAD